MVQNVHEIASDVSRREGPATRPRRKAKTSLTPGRSSGWRVPASLPEA